MSKFSVSILIAGISILLYSVYYTKQHLNVVTLSGIDIPIPAHVRIILT